MDPDQKTWLAGVFDRAAPAYDRVGVPYHEHFARRLVDLAVIPAGAALLDVGCGRGAVLLAAARAGRTAALTGVDVSAGMLDQARAELGTAARLEVMDAEGLAFADGSFDVLTAAFLLFFLPDPARAAAEFHRVLRPGGRIAVSTWGADDPRWEWEDDLLAGLTVDRRAIQRPFASPEDVTEMLAGAGFAGITAHREELEIRFADPEQWWDWHWSFSLRGLFEQLDAAALDRLRAEGTARMRAAGTREMLLTAWVVTADRA